MPGPNSDGFRAVFGALGVFVVVNLILALLLGVRMGQDSGIYIDGASSLLQGQPLAGRQPSYSGYIAFVAVFKWLGLGAPGVVAGQLIAASGAAAIVFLAAFTLGGSLAGVVAVLLLAADIETNRWHAYVLSDSLFASALLVVTWLVYRAAIAHRASRYAAASVAMIATAMIRPEGWFVVPAAAVFWIGASPLDRRRRAVGSVALLATCAVLVIVVAPRLGGNMEAVGPAKMLRLGQTIWDYDGWRLDMPPGPPPRPEVGSAVNAIAYAISHPISTITLMAARVAVHFAHVRPFFSLAHNVLIVAWLVPVYLCAARGAFVARDRSLVAWCATVVGSQTLVVALTHADWDGRYLAHVVGLIYPFAAVGGVDVVSRWRRRSLGVAALA